MKDYALIFLILLSFTSIIFNVVLFYKHKHKHKISKKESLELQEFLADLMGGVGLIAVTRVDPGNILMRSPRAR